MSILWERIGKSPEKLPVSYNRLPQRRIGFARFAEDGTGIKMKRTINKGIGLPQRKTLVEPDHQATQQEEHDDRFDNCLAEGTPLNQADRQRCQSINRAEQTQPEADGG